MNICLNPSGGHASPPGGTQPMMCPRADCGFLIAGTAIENWQVNRLVRRHGSVDAYLASTPDPAVREHKFAKVLRYNQPGSLMRLERLLALQHPSLHLYQHTGWINQDNSLYLLSRYEEMGSLARYLATSTPLPLATIASSILQIAHALHYLHGQNIAHGRVRPENCLIVNSSTIQLSDFYHGLLSREIVVESSLYTAPEQTQGMYLLASDQYSLAVLACQLLACHLIPRAPGDSKQLQLRADTVPPDKILPAFPVPVQQTLAQALHNDVGQRFSDILEFASQLQNALGLGRQNSRPLGAANSLPSESSPLAALPRPIGNQLSPDSGPLRAFHAYRNNSGEFSKQAIKAPTRPVLIPQPVRLPAHTSEISALRWAPDGEYLASAGLDQDLMIWFVRQRVATPLGTVMGHSATVKALNWSPDGRRLVSAADDGSIRLWHITATPSFQMQAEASWWGHEGSITTIAWSPNPNAPQLASGGRDQMLYRWDKQGNRLASWQAHGRGGVTALSWSPDGRIIATGGGDHQIYLWDSQSGQRIGHFAGHADEIRDLRWSADGKLLASCAGKKDTHIIIWDLQTRQRRFTFGGHKREVTGFFWSSDGAWLISVGADRTIHYWNLTQPTEANTNEQLDMAGASPLTIDGTATTNMLAVGASDMRLLLFQLK
jgi:serine/threonine protein kinase